MGIFTNLFGNPNSDIINDKIDHIINNLPIRQADKQFDNLVTGALSDIISITGDKAADDKAKGNLSEIEKMLEGIAIPEMRLRRYDTYDDLYKSIQLVKRILKVYIANIFQKDTVSNTMILLKETELSKNYEKLPEIKQLIKNVLKFFKLDEKLKYNTAFNMLKYGDAFIEIIDLTNLATSFPIVTSASTKDDNIITECYAKINSKNEYINSIDIDFLDRFSETLVEFNNEVYISEEEREISSKYITEVIDGKKSSDDTGENPDEDDEDSLAAFTKKLQKIMLKFHTPHRIVPLVSPYDNILGYVELKETNKQTTSTNVLRQFTDIIDKVGSKYPGNKENKYDEVLKNLSQLIVKKILIKNGITKANGLTDEEYETKIQSQLGDDMFFNLKRTLVGLDHNSLFRKKLSIRFIEPKSMFWFRTPSSDFYPFGVSVIDALVHPGKLYMFNQLANSVYKLSRASQIRKWTVETGSKQDHASLLQKLKKNFASNRITAGDLSSTKDVANILSDFRDLVVNNISTKLIICQIN